MTEDKNTTVDPDRVSKKGIIYVIRTFISLLLQAVFLFAAAGHFNLPRAWIFLGAAFVCFLANTIIMVKLNPALVNQRARRRQDTKSWDRVLLPLFIIIGFYLVPITIGLDVGRFKWSHLSIHFAVLGFVLYITSVVLATLSMVQNKFFEVSVRHQKDRDQQVVTTGTYNIVRHPGYTAGVLGVLGVPLVIGSVFGLIPAGIAVLVLIIRTSLEDKALHQELAGYPEYAKRVKYRLFPGIW